MTVTQILKTRRLPTSGEVLVTEGETVLPDTVIARSEVINPELHELKLFSLLRVDPEAVKNHLTKHEGEPVSRDEVIALSRSFFTRQTRVARAPIDGVIESVSSVSGRMMIRGNPIQLEVTAYIPGVVKEVILDEGAIIETNGVQLDGVFGIGSETFGELHILHDQQSIISARDIGPEHKGKILVGGACASLDALRAAVRFGVKGLIVGGIDQKDITYFLGYEIGVPITGKENAGLTLIMTEGFGVHPMKKEVFEVLSANEGNLTCINGTTHIRSRAIRPEIIIPNL